MGIPHQKPSEADVPPQLSRLWSADLGYSHDVHIPRGGSFTRAESMCRLVDLPKGQASGGPRKRLLLKAPKSFLPR